MLRRTCRQRFHLRNEFFRFILGNHLDVSGTSSNVKPVVGYEVIGLAGKDIKFDLRRTAHVHGCMFQQEDVVPWLDWDDSVMFMVQFYNLLTALKNCYFARHTYPSARALVYNVKIRLVLPR